MFSSYVVLLREGRADLFLSSAKFDKNGTLVSGYVENGAWDFQIKDGKELAKAGNKVRNKWPARLYEIIDVKDQKGDYNAVMRWAETQSKFIKE